MASGFSTLNSKIRQLQSHPQPLRSSLSSSSNSAATTSMANTSATTTTNNSMVIGSITLPASSTEEVLQLEESLAVESTKTDYVSQVFYLCIF